MGSEEAGADVQMPRQLLTFRSTLLVTLQQRYHSRAINHNQTVSSDFLSGCPQNYGPVLGIKYITAPDI